MAELKINASLFEKIVAMADALEIAIDGLQEMKDDSQYYGCVHDVQAEEILKQIKVKLGVSDNEEPEGSGKGTLQM